MQSIISKAILTIKVSDFFISYYPSTIDNDDTVYIDANSVKDIVKKSIDEVETINIEYLTTNNELISNNKAYSIYDFIEHLKPKPLKAIARYGLKIMVNDLLTYEFEDVPTPKRELSEFDKKILQAMKYNPKEKK